MQTPKKGRTILVSEGELEVRGNFEMALKCFGYSVEVAQDGAEVLSCLNSSPSSISAVLLDVMTPNRDGIDTLRKIRRFDADLPVIIVSDAASPVDVVTAMKGGATDFLSKPVADEDLRRAVTSALETKEAESIPQPRHKAPVTKAFLGMNPRMKQIQALMEQIGGSEAPVLIQGETGSGKEVIARELHARSPRADRAFLKLNCAALPSELVESELFGYERGAFTGATTRRSGMFEMADTGTIFLDEVGDMDVRVQAKLLHVLQDQEFQRIGGRETVAVDVRVMAATHRDLEKAILDRTFREDLYYRLNVINLQIPALRDRKDDLLALAEFLIKKHAQGGPTPSITLDLRDAMMAYDWPGNIRELENFVRKLLIFRDPDSLARELFVKTTRKSASATYLAASPAPAPPDEGAISGVLETATRAKQQAETDAILSALNCTCWNRKQAAALLNIEYKSLLYKMGKLGVKDRPAPFAGSSQAPTQAREAHGD